MLTIAQLSGLLNIKVSTLYAWVSQAKIPHLKIHGLIRFQPNVIQQWVEGFNAQKVVSLKLQEMPDMNASRVDALIVRAKRKAYNHCHGETRPNNRALKEKEETNGAL